MKGLMPAIPPMKLVPSVSILSRNWNRKLQVRFGEIKVRGQEQRQVSISDEDLG